MMTLFELIKLGEPAVRPEMCKVHCAVWNGEENPLDVFLAGEFREWQASQNNKNFERPYIVSIIQMVTDHHWLFAGLYRSLGCQVAQEDPYIYETVPVSSLERFVGKAVFRFEKKFRSCYLRGEKWQESILLHEIKPERVKVPEFPGFRKIRIPKAQLDLIVSHNIESWRVALSSVAGVYVITDTASGKTYVGSATGGNGLWQRWSEYVTTGGHGTNAQLMELLNRKGVGYSQNFQFSVLEAVDIYATRDDVLARESHWKSVLCSREFGYN